MQKTCPDQGSNLGLMHDRCACCQNTCSMHCLQLKAYQTDRSEKLAAKEAWHLLNFLYKMSHVCTVYSKGIWQTDCSKKWVRLPCWRLRVVSYMSTKLCSYRKQTATQWELDLLISTRQFTKVFIKNELQFAATEYDSTYSNIYVNLFSPIY